MPTTTLPLFPSAAWATRPALKSPQEDNIERGLLHLARRCDGRNSMIAWL